MEKGHEWSKARILIEMGELGFWGSLKLGYGSGFGLSGLILLIVGVSLRSLMGGGGTALIVAGIVMGIIDAALIKSSLASFREYRY